MNKNCSAIRPPHPLALLHLGWEQYTYQYIYPIQLFVTFVGNILVISVLLGSQVRNRANHLLALLALCDVLVLVLLFPEFLAAILPTFSPRFRIFYVETKVVFGALTNWFSAAAIWFVLAVSIERLVIIKFPFRSLNNFSNVQTIAMAVLVLGGTFLLTSYHYFSWTCTYKVVCNGLMVAPIFLPNTDVHLWTRYNMTNPYSPRAQTVIRFAAVLNTVFAVIAPVFAVTLINMALLKLIKKRNSQELVTSCLQQKGPSAQLQQERRMTRTVVAIVTCFSVTQGPSAVLFLYEALSPHPISMSFTHLKTITNSLVFTGKMCNVVLFCLTSSIFRRRLLLALRMWTGGVFKMERRKTLLSTRSLSRSLLTQKTSVAHSPSIRVVPRTSQMKRMESFNLQLIRRDDNGNTEVEKTSETARETNKF
ncbi:unnamed protein product, partial [Mesorhabditis belari]|uniref:G-protein coupled receptors family 1 profile domain-containing protein n=1 Tax=Mesorhabditis belari TaxID=2138241 RepID=A0AAF3FI48_9BILA